MYPNQPNPTQPNQTSVFPDLATEEFVLNVTAMHFLLLRNATIVLRSVSNLSMLFFTLLSMSNVAALYGSSIITEIYILLDVSVSLCLFVVVKRRQGSFIYTHCDSNSHIISTTSTTTTSYQS